MSATTGTLLRASQSPALDDLERGVVNYFVDAAQLLGLPKSLGEIYAIIYISPEPLNMETITHRLRLSLGSVSQGLRQLRKMQAVRVVQIPGERRDYYEAETELRRLIGNFLEQVVSPQLAVGVDHLKTLSDKVETLEAARTDHYRKRIAKLEQWHQAGSKLIPRMAQWIRI